MNFAAQIMLCEGENTPISAIHSLTSYAGVFRGARISSLPLVGRDEIRVPLKRLRGRLYIAMHV